MSGRGRRGGTGGALGRLAPGLPVLGALVFGALLPGDLLPGVLPAGAAPVPAGHSFSRLNRTYDDLVADLEPVTQGAVVLRIASPSNRLVIESHLLELTPLADGTHRAVLDVVFLGGAHLVGRVELAGTAAPVDDRVVLPRQRLRIPARLRVRPGADGIELTAVELPDGLAVAVQSTSGNQFLGWCEQLGAFLPVDCSALDLTSVQVPLPAPGETYVVPYEEIEPAERTALLRYIEETAGPR